MKYRLRLLFVFTVFFSCVENVSLTKSLLDFVPESASIVIQINDLSAFKDGLSSNTFLKDIRQTQTFEEAFEKISFLDFLNPKSKSILVFIENETGEFESIFLTENAPTLVLEDSASNSTIEEVDFRGIALTKYKTDKEEFFQATLGSKFVMASSAEVVEQLIESLKNNTANETLKKLYNISNGYKPATLYIDIKKSSPWLMPILKNESKIDISKFSDWILLDFNPKPSQVNLTGISVANDSVWNFIDLFANTKPLTNVTPSLAPDQIDVLLSFTFDNYNTFANNQRAFLTENLSVNPLFETVEEVGIIHSNGLQAVFLSTHGSETLSDYITKSSLSTIDYQGNQIIQLKNKTFIQEGFRPLVKNFSSNFCTFINDAVVFCESKEFLERIVSNYKNGSTYDKGSIFQGLNKSLAEESSILFLSNSTDLKDIFSDDLSSIFNKELDNTLKSQYDIAAQVTTDKNFYHTNIIIEKNKKTADNKGIAELVKIKIDTTVTNPPQFVTNHITKKKEIVVQDYKNVLYLIALDGKVLWKKQLKSQIQGTIKQVDIFKNGRLQMAFTTNNQFLVLDRNGKEVEKFTKTFEGGGLNPLAVFDYERKKNYRFVITQGKKTFMYNSKAEIVRGFKYTDAEDLILDAPKHIVIGNKDHLVFKLKNGSLKILNRVGNVRVKVVEKIDFSENKVFLNKDKFIVTDKKGTLYQVDQKGKITKTNFNLSNDHGMFSTANTLVLMNDNILTIRGKKVELELGVYTTPKIFYINNKIYVSVTDLQSQRVYLFDSQAKSIPNFPVFGNSIIDLADVNMNNTLEMVVLGNKNELITYKLN